MGSSRKAKARRKTTHTKVKASPAQGQSALSMYDQISPKIALGQARQRQHARTAALSANPPRRAAQVGLRKKRYRVPLPVVLPGTEER